MTEQRTREKPLEIARQILNAFNLPESLARDVFLQYVATELLAYGDEREREGFKKAWAEADATVGRYARKAALFATREAAARRVLAAKEKP